MDEDELEHDFDGWFSRIVCGNCGEIFEVEDDVQNGVTLMCDACNAELPVRRLV